MAKYTAGEIHFNLMALIQDRTVRCQIQENIWWCFVKAIQCVENRRISLMPIRYNSQLKEVASLPADVQVGRKTPSHFDSFFSSSFLQYFPSNIVIWILQASEVARIEMMLADEENKRSEDGWKHVSFLTFVLNMFVQGEVADWKYS